ncbi:MAG: tRNA pseudouridine(13) synthase TruD [Candidatus Marsarchaeota archaeon]|nr:tRNA pseudouridine(13) synthase TruD [Candidatus Marsarchaeota archaeon]MCL5105836.1 tRNA pseudouridine(13) synthase TruD [Candidatus Marsarchaeota archaeon]
MLLLNNHISKPVRGAIKFSAEDFIVEEITNNGTVLERDRRFNEPPFIESDSGGGKNAKSHSFALFIMQKKNWNTIQALTAIARKFGRSFKSAGFAGTKDRASISTQLCTMFEADPEKLLELQIKDIQINGAWRVNRKIELGDLLGNKFGARIRNAKINSSIKESLENLKGVFPNYFGEQRFGNRSNNYFIGIDILKGDFEAAAMRFLTDTQNELNKEAVEARTRLLNERDFDSALGYFPKYLKYERLVLHHLSRLPNDYAGALRKLPRSLSLLFMHSIDSFIFNKELEVYVKDQDRIKESRFFCNADSLGFPDLTNLVSSNSINPSQVNSKVFAVASLVGYNSNLNDTEKEIISELGLEQEMFRTKKMPELNCKGAYRTLFSPFYNFSFNAETDEAGGADFAEFRFSLPKSSYATVFLAEFVNSDQNKE